MIFFLISLFIIFFAKEFIVINEDIVVICAFITVFFLLKNSLAPSFVRLLEDRSNFIKVSFSYHLLELEKIQLHRFLLHPERAFYFCYFQDIFLSSFGDVFLSFSESFSLFLLEKYLIILETLFTENLPSDQKI